MARDVFRVFGNTVRYRVGGLGEGVDIRALHRRKDDDLRAGEALLRIEGDAYEVRTADIAQPVAGDTLTLPSGVVRVVQGAPTRNDEGTVWLLDTMPL